MTVRAADVVDTGEVCELFDLVVDPDEANNRADDESAGAEVDRLRGLLASTLETT